MSPPEHKRAPRRRTIFIDSQLQGRLALALVVLEVSLLGAACAYLYHALADLIEGNLYVIHASERAELLPAMLHELGMVALVCAAINSLALLATHAMWVRQVARVLAALRARLDRVRALELGPASAEGEPEHRLLGLCDRWIGVERARAQALGEALSRLPAGSPEKSEIADTRAALEEALRLLHRGERARPSR